VTPINTATNKAGKPIHVRGVPAWIAITPDGNTAYAVTAAGRNPSPITVWVTPITTATNTPGQPIPLGATNLSATGGSGQIAIAPNGKTAYVATVAGVTPINTATNTAGQPIHIANLTQIAITPDGKTLYAATAADRIIPINTATGTPGQPIPVISRFNPAIAITP
jgi:hyaluronoglucosaminidase